MPYTTADVAKAGRTTARGVHIWDREKLLGPVERNRFQDRVFTDAHLKRAKIIAAAQMAGMSLAEIRGASDQALWNRVNDAANFLVSIRSQILGELDL